MPVADDDPSKQPQWQTDRIFHSLTAGMKSAFTYSKHDLYALEKQDVNLHHPRWPHWFATHPDELLSPDHIGQRFMGLLMVSVLTLPFSLVWLGSTFTLMLFLIGVPALYVPLIGRRSPAYCGWNIGFWLVYAVVLFIFAAHG